METRQVLMKSLEESQQYLARALKELTKEDIAWTPKADCNSIIFILWHLARVEDSWINRRLRNTEELYESEGWRERLGTPVNESGGRYTAEQLQSWSVPKVEIVQGYASSVREKTIDYLASLDSAKLSEVVLPGQRFEDVGSILSHLVTEIALHAGQVDYLRGMIRGLQP